MARFSGTADNGDINVALALAIKHAKEGLGAKVVTWVMLVAFGSSGGGDGDQNEITVEIEASAP